MPFPPAFIDEVIARNPIEDVVGQYVTLKRSGSNLFGLCPFHGEKTASFSVAPDKGMFYCFGCHKGGGVISGRGWKSLRTSSTSPGIVSRSGSGRCTRKRRGFSTAACTHLWARRHWNTPGGGECPRRP